MKLDFFFLVNFHFFFDWYVLECMCYGRYAIDKVSGQFHLAFLIVVQTSLLY